MTNSKPESKFPPSFDDFPSTVTSSQMSSVSVDTSLNTLAPATGTSSSANTSSRNRVTLTELSKAFLVFTNWADTLTDIDKLALTRFAMGEDRKQVAHDLDIPYGTLCKRLERWQQSLGLRHQAHLIHLWFTVQMAIAPHEHAAPTILRHTPHLAAMLASSQADRKGVEPSGSQAKSVIARSRLLQQGGHRVQAYHHTALRRAVMCPTVWSIALLATEMDKTEVLRTKNVVSKHALFLATAGARSSSRPMNWDWITSTAGSRDRDFYREPLLLTAVTLGVVPYDVYLSAGHSPDRSWSPSYPSLYGLDKPDELSYSIEDDGEVWSKWRDGVRRGNAASAWQLEVTRSTVNGPLTGLIVAAGAEFAEHEGQRTRCMTLYNEIADQRINYAEALHIHPVRLLSYFAHNDLGIDSETNSFFLRAGETLMSFTTNAQPAG